MPVRPPKPLEATILLALKRSFDRNYTFSLREAEILAVLKRAGHSSIFESAIFAHCQRASPTRHRLPACSIQRLNPPEERKGASNLQILHIHFLRTLSLPSALAKV
jgi:hypothetical protein